MKKLFVSVPMRGRTEENIKKSMEKMHKLAEIIFDQELEVIPSYVEHNPPEDSKKAVWYLSESIKKLAGADYFIGVSCSRCWRGCCIEFDVARGYDIPYTMVHIEDVAPDAIELEYEYWGNKRTHSPNRN